MNEDAAPTVDPYQRIADLYDLEHDEFRDDIDLLLQFAEGVEGPILELGCGSGRILAPMAEVGLTVVGMDTSEAMLARARTRIASANLGGRVTLVAGDMTDATIAPGGPFSLVVFSLNALMHLDTPVRQLEALRNARRVLASHGQLIIDLVNPTPDYLVSLAAGPALEGSWVLDDNSIVDKLTTRTISACDQTIGATIWYDILAPDGQLVRLRTHFELRYLHRNELTLMLTDAGYGDIRVYGSYEMDPFDDASDRMVVTARPTQREVGVL